MKAILMSIKPKWCEKIFSGEKTVEVRKSAPKLEPPFKVYVYETKTGFIEAVRGTCPICAFSRGKVIGSFVCDKVIEYGYDVIACAKFEVNGAYVEEAKRYNAGGCLSEEEMYEYSNGKPLYGWHITKVKLYDTPRELGEFKTPDKPYHKIIERKGSLMFIDGYESGKPLKRAPQSWQFVEEVEE